MIQKYLELTNSTLPALAKERKFPVRFNHCFQRIILDNIFGCCWYERIDRSNKIPAYKQLTSEQLQAAIALAEEIICNDSKFLCELNNRSLRWRGKL